MERAITDEMERLARMPVQQLRARYREVYGEDSSSGHLVRRIAWRLQVLAQGDLTERAERRAREIANDADLKTQVPRVWAGSAGASVPTSRRDRRLPVAGTVLCRRYRERTVEVKVLAE
jgi:mannitol-1-phosphate/altronate dehydrogenase